MLARLLSRCRPGRIAPDRRGFPDHETRVPAAAAPAIRVSRAEIAALFSADLYGKAA